MKLPKQLNKLKKNKQLNKAHNQDQKNKQLKSCVIQMRALWSMAHGLYLESEVRLLKMSIGNKSNFKCRYITLSKK